MTSRLSRNSFESKNLGNTKLFKSFGGNQHGLKKSLIHMKKNPRQQSVENMMSMFNTHKGMIQSKLNQLTTKPGYLGIRDSRKNPIAGRMRASYLSGMSQGTMKSSKSQSNKVRKVKKSKKRKIRSHRNKARRNSQAQN